MRIAINGVGIAGASLAWWLKEQGHEPVLFERSPTLRTGGHMIDFWGAGYDVAERMGILSSLEKHSYAMKALRVVDAFGRAKASINARAIHAVTGGRFFTIKRGDLLAEIYRSCGEIETHFGVSVSGVEQRSTGVDVSFSDGHNESFDLVVGCDGLHSKVRELAFGSMSQFERPLNFHIAAFQVTGYPFRDERTYVVYSIPRREIVRITLRDDRTMFLILFRSSLLDSDPLDEASQRDALHVMLDDPSWEVPTIREELSRSDGLYFARVSQIVVDEWARGRVGLLGDAAACVSPLAGEGAGLAMTQAYVLADELNRSGADPNLAFGRFQDRMQAYLARKQLWARRSSSLFAPTTRAVLRLRNLGIHLASFPRIAKLLVGHIWSDRLDSVAAPNWPSQTTSNPRGWLLGPAEPS